MTTKSLYAKLAEVQAAVGKVDKTGYNSNQKYHYITEADLIDALRPLLAERNLAFCVDFEDYEVDVYEDVTARSGNAIRFAHVKARARLLDGDTKDVLAFTGCGFAEDTGDKAIYKAQTSASKYLYYKVFGVSAGDDVETVGNIETAQKEPSSRRGRSSRRS